MDFVPSESYFRMTQTPGGFTDMQRVMDIILAIKRKGGNFIDCGLGESSHGLLENCVKEGIKALKKDECDYIKPTQGMDELRIAISKYISKDLNIKVDEGNVIVTPGSELALDLVLKTILNPGDEVIIFDPFFIPFASLSSSYFAKPVFVTTYNSDFLPDIKKLEKVINKRTKLIIINSPNNPTGRIIPRELIQKIVKLAKKRKILLLSDEAYRFFDYEKKFVSPFTYYPEGTIVLRTFSKEYCMMGFKIGYIVADKKIVNYVTKIQYPGWGAPQISSIMALAGLRTGIPGHTLERYKSIRDSLYNNLKDLGLISYLPEGAFYFYIKSPVGKAIDFAIALAKKGLFVIPAFSLQSSHVRLSYGKLGLNHIPEIVNILKKFSNV